MAGRRTRYFQVNVASAQIFVLYVPQTFLYRNPAAGLHVCLAPTWNLWRQAVDDDDDDVTVMKIAAEEEPEKGDWC